MLKSIIQEDESMPDPRLSQEIYKLYWKRRRNPLWKFRHSLTLEMNKGTIDKLEQHIEVTDELTKLSDKLRALQTQFKKFINQKDPELERLRHKYSSIESLFFDNPDNFRRLNQNYQYYVEMKNN